MTPNYPYAAAAQHFDAGDQRDTYADLALRFRQWSAVKVYASARRRLNRL